MISGLGLGHCFRSRPNTIGAGFDAATIFQQRLQIQTLFFLCRDIGVTAGKAVERSTAADGTDSSHNKTKMMSRATLA